MSITTKTGDKGYTSVANKRVKKNSKVIEAIGDLDELQSIVEDVAIQNDLYEIMGTIACETRNKKLETRIKYLDNEITNLEKTLKPLTKFLIFKKEKARKFNWIRTVTRRAERSVVFLKNDNILIYLNRLSDYFYLLSRIEEEK